MKTSKMKHILVLLILIAVNYGCRSQTNFNKDFFDIRDTAKKASTSVVKDTSIHTGSIMDIMRQMNKGIDSLKMTGNANKDFADLMIIHHKAAIDMAEMESSFGEHATVARKAQEIASVQKKEIATFQAFLLRYVAGEKIDSFRYQVVPVIASMQHTTHSTSTIDNQFIEMMLIHHNGAIDISKLYLKYAKDAKLKALARRIILANQLEVPKLKKIKPD
jgi:uncharacterized protein (DUF305 family)